MNDPKEKDKKEKEKEQEQQPEECCGECKHDEIEELRTKLLVMELELEKVRREQNDRIMEFVDKKSKEATEIIEAKRREIEERSKQEYGEKMKYFYSKQLGELVDVVSQFEMVINGVTDPAVSAYLVGFKMFLSQFESLLSSFSITAIEPKEGDEFDSDIMEATSTKKVEDSEFDNKIVRVLKKGYRLHDRVIKLAAVEVGKV